MDDHSKHIELHQDLMRYFSLDPKAVENYRLSLKDKIYVVFRVLREGGSYKFQKLKMLYLRLEKIKKHLQEHRQFLAPYELPINPVDILERARRMNNHINIRRDDEVS